MYLNLEPKINLSVQCRLESLYTTFFSNSRKLFRWMLRDCAAPRLAPSEGVQKGAVVGGGGTEPIICMRRAEEIETIVCVRKELVFVRRVNPITAGEKQVHEEIIIRDGGRTETRHYGESSAVFQVSS